MNYNLVLCKILLWAGVKCDSQKELSPLIRYEPQLSVSTIPGLKSRLMASLKVSAGLTWINRAAKAVSKNTAELTNLAFGVLIKIFRDANFPAQGYMENGM